jgi:hypothetical protein
VPLVFLGFVKVADKAILLVLRQSVKGVVTNRKKLEPNKVVLDRLVVNHHVGLMQDIPESAKRRRADDGARPPGGILMEVDSVDGIEDYPGIGPPFACGFAIVPKGPIEAPTVGLGEYSDCTAR